MKIKLYDVINNTEQLKALQDVKFPVKVSYKINRLVSKLEPELKAFNETRSKLIMELGEQQENGETKITNADKIIDFQNKIKELFDQEIEIDWFVPIKLEEVGDISIASKDLVDWIFAHE